jgi:hypothetical protein
MKLLRTILIAAAVAATGIGVFAKGIDDPARDSYYVAFKGKKVAFVPIAMGFDLTEGWAAGLKQALEPLGVTVEIRDPNWSTDAGAQAITSLIQEKPDAIVVHNPDVQSYARLLKKAEEAGIYVVQVNMRSSYSTDGFVGADYVGLGEAIANRLVDKCSPAKGGNGKIAIMQGVLTRRPVRTRWKASTGFCPSTPRCKSSQTRRPTGTRPRRAPSWRPYCNSTRTFAAASASGTSWMSARVRRSKSRASRSIGSPKAAAIRLRATMLRTEPLARWSSTTLSVRRGISPT